MKNFRLKTLSLCTVAVCLSLIGCGSKEDEQAAAQAAAAQQEQAKPVGVMIAQSQQVENFVELAARASAYEVSEVRPQATGVILKRFFAEGSYVKAGQPLYEIDSRSGQATVENAKAAILRNKANLQALQTKEQRYRQLVGTNAISKQDYDDVVTQMRLAQADLLASEATLKNAQVSLGHSIIRAPISGQTSRSNVTVGALVTANQADALVTIQRLDPIYIDINQSSAELLRLRQQMSEGNISSTGNVNVKLKLENGTDYPVQGKLTFAGAQVNEQTGSVTLRAVFPNNGHVLLPGMYATAKLPQGAFPHAYLVPQTAITRNATGQATVKVVDIDNRVKSVVITTQGTKESNWIVTDGIQNGQKVIIVGNAKVSDGDLVEAQIVQGEASTAAAPTADVNPQATAPSENAPTENTTEQTEKTAQ